MNDQTPLPCPECASLRATVADLLTELARMVRCSERGHELGNVLGSMALKHCAEMAKLAIAKAGGEPPEPIAAERSQTKAQEPAIDEEPPHGPKRGDPTSVESWAVPTPETASRMPLIIEGFHIGEQWIAARKPIKLRVSPYPRYNMLLIDNCEPFWLGASGSTDDELRESVERDFGFLWLRYVQEGDRNPSEDARKLKCELLAAFTSDVGTEVKAGAA